ncbi:MULTISPECIES: helix-turn-helix domain-containing protein [unclassified Haladaptatus]|uniref:helix-turn-helix domain-containing protein n=1 Tax=unclassified Haladaptatus TaxID=2622732 RepID=UPI00209C59CB|nr:MULTISPECIES: helix-turn-helix domain-containing protein [unclassified Haladaptatus]MCO8243420.1 helix-turn-helix domain-containing protein [Haladaptatus sp. AB643]MCO8254827.1 helix-turn-helix domain-containing protein [Haladaptatus sp. AB618]
MLTSEVRVRYEGDWTAQLAEYDVFGEFIASTFRNHRYIGMLALETNDYEGTVEVIRSHKMVDTIDVVERYRTGEGRYAATILLRGRLTELTPLQALMYEGYLPIGPTKLENGCEYFNLLLGDRDELTTAIELLSEFGSVSVERITRDFRREIMPSRAEWQELLESIPPRQREFLNTSVENGYFEIPREVTLEELAEEMDITKTTASNHLRKAERTLIAFVLPYINLAVGDGDSL